MTTLNKLIRDEDGATAIEYGLIAALIAVGLIATLQSVGGNLKGVFEKADGGLKTASTGTA